MFKGYEWVMYICLLAITGSAAMYVHGGNGADAAAAVLAGSFALFLVIIADVAAYRIVEAVKEQKMQDADVQIAEIAGRAVYRAIAEEQAKRKD